MPNVLVYGCKKSRPTASAIAEKLGAVYKEGFVDNPEEYELIFRYGNSAEIRSSEYCKHPFTLIENLITVINKPKSIRLACNKLDARKELLKYVGRSYPILVPKTWEDSRDIPLESLPVIARPHYHSQGRRFKVITSPRELVKCPIEGWYYSEIIKKRDEYRLFVFRNKVMEVDKKIKNREDADMLIRSHRKGWRFKHNPFTQTARNIVDTAILSCQYLNLDFGAVDIADTDNDSCYVLEVNSAPGLIDRKVELLCEKIRRNYFNA